MFIGVSFGNKHFLPDLVNLLRENWGEGEGRGFPGLANLEFELFCVSGGGKAWGCLGQAQM